MRDPGPGRRDRGPAPVPAAVPTRPASAVRPAAPGAAGRARTGSSSTRGSRTGPTATAEPGEIDDRVLYRRPDALPLRPGRRPAGARGAGRRRDGLPHLPAELAAHGLHPDRTDELMPIRSPHGRAAAYRPFWQWPLRSPRRLAATVLMVIALAAAGSYAIGGFSGGPRWAADRVADGPPSRPRRPDGHRAAPGARAGTADAAAVEGPAGRAGRGPALGPAGSGRPPAPAPGSGWPVARPPPTSTSACWPRSTRRTSRPAGDRRPAADPGLAALGQVQVQTDGPTLPVLVVDTEDGWRVSGYDRA